jgi:hypothetical protein
MTIGAFDFSRLDVSQHPERRERPRFRLACPIRLLRDGAWIGESRTRDINCESFSCVLPDPHAAVVCGDVLECEIDLASPTSQDPHRPSIQLRCHAMVLRVAGAEAGFGVEVVCRLLGYNIGLNRTFTRR